MGYSCCIRSNKEITETDIQKIVDNIPNKFKGIQFPVFSVKQPWGWSLYSDINLPKGNEVVITGSCSVSGDDAEAFIGHVVGELKSHGHILSFNTTW